MGVMTNFVSLMMSAITAFSITYSDPNIRPAPEVEGTNLQMSIDEATQDASSSGLDVGIAVIDRANNNLMKTNDEAAHREFKMETAGRLPILIYMARMNENFGTYDHADATAMIQGVSGEATQRLWDYYGGQTIIADTAERYNLQETSSGETWRDTTSSAVDMGRMYRRFLDDDEVSIEAKKYAVELLRGTSLEVVGEDFAYGLPNAFGLDSDMETNGNSSLAWMQGWSQSGSEDMIRTTSGVIDPYMRFIVIITAETDDPEMPDGTANAIISDVAETIIGGSGRNLEEDDESSSVLEEDTPVEAFEKMQENIYGDEFIQEVY